MGRLWFPAGSAPRPVPVASGRFPAAIDWGSAGVSPRFSSGLPLAEKQRYHRKKWLMKLIDPGRETPTKPSKKDEARKEALRIEELEARLAPTALWGE
jgi:hypothetical protein